MKKAITLILALVICLALAVPALAGVIIADYEELYINGIFDLQSFTMFGVNFEAVKRETAALTFYSEETGFTTEDNCSILSVKPGSQVTVDNPKADNVSGVAAYRLREDGSYEKYPDGVLAIISSGGVDDWPLGKSLLGEGDIVGLLEFSGFDVKYVRLGEAEEAAPAEPETGAGAEELRVRLSNQSLKVNGETRTTEIYNINDKNYFKLRDIAMLLNGTGSQFSVDYDETTRTIVITTGEAYVPKGNELLIGEDKSASCVLSTQSVIINGQKVDFTAYNLEGNNFFGLRELGDALNFDVDYDTATRTMLVTSK